MPVAQARVSTSSTPPGNHLRSRCFPIGTPNPTLLDHASSLHASQSLFPFPNATGGPASGRAFLRNVLSGGTLSDRFSSLTFMHTFTQHLSVIGFEVLDGKGARWCQYVNRTVATGREESLRAARQLWTGWRRRPESKA
jgi:hypothetical protein